jgi:hypothetical protein
MNSNSDRPWYFRIETIVATSVALFVVCCCSTLLIFRCICAKRFVCNAFILYSHLTYNKRKRSYEFGFVEDASEEERQQLRNEKMNLISRRSKPIETTTSNTSTSGRPMSVSLTSGSSSFGGYEMSDIDLQTSLNQLIHTVSEGLRGTDLTVDRPDMDLSNHNVKCFIAKNSSNARYLISVTYDKKRVIENENEKLVSVCDNVTHTRTNLFY